MIGHLASHLPKPPPLPSPGGPFEAPPSLPYWLSVEPVAGDQVGLFVNFVCDECNYTHAVCVDGVISSERKLSSLPGGSGG